MTHSIFEMTGGQPAPLGATLVGDGVNFAVFSAHAIRIEVCLFSADGTREVQRLALPERAGDIWFGHVPGLKAGQLYGLRVHGPYRPDEGHRFNPNKLLLDPYARRLSGLPRWDDALYGYQQGAQSIDLSFDTRDSARSMPLCVVTAPLPQRPRPPRPKTAMDRTVIYEAHVKGLTQMHPHVEAAGTFAGLAEPAVVEHLLRLGVTAVELLPIHASLTDRFLHDKGLVNYWGYQTLGYFAPHPAYVPSGDLTEVTDAIDKLHAAGIEVVLDVVYNHTCEGSELGPTLSWRGLDNASYYRLAPDPRRFVNDTGTGNTLNLDHPMVLRMVLDSLRYWAELGVDGFRFDLGSTLARTHAAGGGFDPASPFFAAIRQDPILAPLKLISEPWDIGPGGYRLGGFPPPFSEWNDKYRDGVRRFWRGDPGRAPDLAARLTGSALQFDHSGRPATSSINFITAHDGFTLADVVSYATKHNHANGEDNRDGHGENYSDNFGIDGPTEDPAVVAARAKRQRAMLATLFLSQGTPMLLAGDEIGHSQGGNNNAYAQDNATTWLNWRSADEALCRFVSKLSTLRSVHPVLRQKRFLHARPRAADGVADVFWWHPSGAKMQSGDWHDPALRTVCVELRMASGTPVFDMSRDAVFAVFNAGRAKNVVCPLPPRGSRWLRMIDSAAPDTEPEPVEDREISVSDQSVVALCLVPEEGEYAPISAPIPMATGDGA